MSSTENMMTVSSFIDWLTGRLDDRKYAEDYAQAVYLKDPDGCMPDDYIGDDLLMSIREKFWYPVRWILEYAAEIAAPAVPLHEFGIVIDPSYEDRTDVLVFYRDRVLFHDSWKAWHFWWPSDQEFERWATEVWSHIQTRLQLNPDRETQESQ
jgi:hypothetical protein